MRLSTLGSGGPMPTLLQLVCLVLATAAPAYAFQSSSDPGAWPRVYIKDAWTAGAVRMALDGAARRLGDPRCQTVLSDFHDQQGRPLTARLAELAPTPRDYLELILFLDASPAPQCQDYVLAFTSPGNRAVFVCPRRFVRAREQDGVLTDAIVIHEMLHTLGLGENPPSTHAITQAVLRNCTH